MRKIARLFAMEWSRMLQYRVETAMWIMAEAMSPLIALAVWYNVAQNSTGVLTPPEVLTYYVLAIFTQIVVNAWGGFFLSQEILNGDIVKYLVRPFSPFWPHIVNNIVEKIIKLLIPLPVLIAVLYFLPSYFSPAIYAAKNILPALFSLLLAAIIAFSLDIAFGALAFWVEDSIQIRRYSEVLYAIASGLLVPFAFMPASVQAVLNFLPYRYIIAAPIEILMGATTGPDLTKTIIIQVAWIVILITALAQLWRRGLKHYAIPGQ